MSWFKQQLRGGHKLIGKSAGETITYRRGDSTVQIRDVTRSESSFMSLSSDGQSEILVTSIDFDIDPCLLILDGNQTEPQIGDQIVATDGVYDTMNGQEGRPWTSDARLTYYQTHTQRRSKT